MAWPIWWRTEVLSSRPPLAEPRRDTLRSTLADLRGTQKPPYGVSIYSVSVNRPAGRIIAAAAHLAGLTPNAVTGLSALSSLSAIAVLILRSPTVLTGCVAAALLALGFALDSADGQLARLHGSGGPPGEWLDHLVDCSVKLALHGGVAVAWYREGVRGALLLVPMAFQAVAVLLFFGGTLAGLLLARAPNDPSRRPGAAQSRRRSLLGLLPVDFGVLCWSFALWGWSPLFRTWYGLLLVVQSLYLAVLSRHWWRQLHASR